jgi:ZIP family zinc transporter
MAEAFAWGAVASFSLVLGCVFALRWQISKLALGLVMAFGAGVLISAVAFELVEEAVDTSAGAGGVGIGFALGSLTFFGGNMLIGRVGARREESERSGSGSAMSIVLGTVLDGIPESIVLGLTLLTGDGVSIAMLAAVFLSNLPESIAATSELKAGGWAPRRLLGLWLLVALVCAVAAAAGYTALDDASPATVAAVLAFAGGAILAMLAETMMPEAFKHGGQLVGPVTSLGFALAFVISSFE